MEMIQPVRKTAWVLRVLVISCLLFVPLFELPAQNTTGDVTDGFLTIETTLGYNTNTNAEYFKMPLIFSGSSADREISARILILSDVLHASDYFSGQNGFLKPRGVYQYNFALIDIDYMNWSRGIFLFGLGAGLAHQGLLIEGSDKSAHALTARLRAHGYAFLSQIIALKLQTTVPIAFFQSATDQFRFFQGEFDVIFDFSRNVRQSQPGSIQLTLNVTYDYMRFNHSIRNYNQHDFIPGVKVMFLY